MDDEELEEAIRELEEYNNDPRNGESYYIEAMDPSDIREAVLEIRMEKERKLHWKELRRLNEEWERKCWIVGITVFVISMLLVWAMRH